MYFIYILLIFPRGKDQVILISKSYSYQTHFNVNKFMTEDIKYLEESFSQSSQ